MPRLGLITLLLSSLLIARFPVRVEVPFEPPASDSISAAQAASLSAVPACGCCGAGKCSCECCGQPLSVEVAETHTPRQGPALSSRLCSCHWQDGFSSPPWYCEPSSAWAALSPAVARHHVLPPPFYLSFVSSLDPPPPRLAR